ncbi:Serine/threonine-protein kinase HT1 [Pelomyxa schiedti]|nr:Serine/threonine-protein kinase HT1 [Pelomyxa schiedti]
MTKPHEADSMQSPSPAPGTYGTRTTKSHHEPSHDEHRRRHHHKHHHRHRHHHESESEPITASGAAGAGSDLVTACCQGDMASMLDILKASTTIDNDVLARSLGAAIAAEHSSIASAIVGHCNSRENEGLIDAALRIGNPKVVNALVGAGVTVRSDSWNDVKSAVSSLKPKAVRAREEIFSMMNSTEEASLLDNLFPSLTVLPTQMCQVQCGVVAQDEFSAMSTYFALISVSDLGITINHSDIDGKTFTQLVPITQHATLHMVSQQLLVITHDWHGFLFSKVSPGQVRDLFYTLDTVKSQAPTVDKLIHSAKRLMNSGTVLDCASIKSMQLLGTGSFGEVWLAVHNSKPVALKRLREDRTASAFAKLLFLQEMLTLNELANEPSVLHFVGLSCNPCKRGGIWMVTEWCAGGSLDKIIFQPFYKPINMKLALALLIKTCLVMKTVHSRDIVHRDLKPENILVMNKANFDLKLSDFGIAMHTSDLEDAAAVNNGYGTQAYTPPESWQELQSTIKGDVYSWGIMALEIMTGTRVFFKVAKDFPGVPDTHWKQNIRKYFKLPTQWPPALQETVYRCCQREGQPTFSEVLVVLQSVKLFGR